MYPTWLKTLHKVAGDQGFLQKPILFESLNHWLGVTLWFIQISRKVVKKTHSSLLVNLVVREVARVSSEDGEVVHFLAEIKLGCQGMNSVARS